jgi:hypothetical protein
LPRRLSRAHGYKLAKLQEIIEDSALAENGEAKQILEFLSHRDIESKDCNLSRLSKSRQKLLSFFEPENNADLYELPVCRASLLKRHYIAGAYQMPFLAKNKQIKLFRCSLADIAGRSFRISKTGVGSSDGQRSTEVYSGLAGRHDLLSIGADQPLSRCYMPEFSEEQDDKYSPFFVRSEVVLRVNNPKRPDNPDSWNPFAFLSISLKRFTVRLDFVLRLRNWLEKETPEKHRRQEKPKHLADLAGLVPLKDIDIYLSDGWGDVLIAFHAKESEDNWRLYKRLKDIFDFQAVVFEDFQVDRTELIPTPRCVDAVMSCSGRENQDDEARRADDFSISVNVRLLEDRYTTDKNDSFVDRVNKQLKNIISNEDIDRVIFTRTPGRMDFTLKFPPGIRFEKPGLKNLLKALLGSGDHSGGNVDRVLTNIGYVCAKHNANPE